MKKLIVFILSLLLIVAGCGVTKPNIPGPSNQVNVRDSIVYNIVDSTVIHPVEVIKDIVPEYDTLKLETSLAEATAYVDTSMHILRGTIKNKEGYNQKIKYVNRIEYRDSIQIKEVPFEVEKIITKTKHPFYESILWFFTVLALLFIAWKITKIYLKI